MIPEDRVTARRIVWFTLCTPVFAYIIGFSLPLMFHGCSVSQHFVGSRLPKVWQTNQFHKKP